MTGFFMETDSNYREYSANQDKRKQHIFFSENDRFDLKTNSDRSFKPILYFKKNDDTESTQIN